MGKSVLSLFDGVGFGMQAFKELGIPIKQYFASEIDKNAISVSMANHPSIIQLGDVLDIDVDSLPSIDYIIGGSPCQGFSFSGKLLNFDDPRSQLFFAFEIIMKQLMIKNPNIKFLLENVRMRKVSEDIITGKLGVPPVLINSSIVSAQNRVRNYWSNYRITQPEDTNINLVDILDNLDYTNPAAVRGRNVGYGGKIIQCLEVKKKGINKSNCITTVSKDNVLTNMAPGQYIGASDYDFREYSVNELCKLQGINIDYFKVVSDNQARKMLGNGWQLDTIKHIFRQIF